MGLLARAVLSLIFERHIKLFDSSDRDCAGPLCAGPVFHRDVERLGEIDVAAEEHFSRGCSQPDAGDRPDSDSVNKVLGHGDRFGRDGKPDLRLLYYWA